MPYTYTQKNLLHEPNSYMYSEYRGRNLIDDYYENRIHLLEGLYAPQKDRFSVIDFHLQEKVRQLVSNNKIGDMAEISTFFSSSIAVPARLKLPLSTHPISKDGSINSLPLFQKILFQMVSDFDKDSKNNQSLAWLDQVLQRFEVSKKLRTRYLPDFRKCESRHDHIGLYQYLSVVLGLAFFKFSEFQYLSTLLKVNDLLLSQPKNFLNSDESLPSWGMGIILELQAVKILD